MASVTSGAGDPSRIPARQYTVPPPSCTVRRSGFGWLPSPSAGIALVQNLLSLVLSLVPSLRVSLQETIPERRMGLEREGKKSSADFWGKVSLGTEIFPFARFGGGKSLVAGEGDVTVQGIVRVVNIVVQRGYGIEGEVVVAEVVVEEEVVEQEVVGEEVEEVGMVNAVGFVEVEVFVERH